MDRHTVYFILILSMRDNSERTYVFDTLTKLNRYLVKSPIGDKVGELKIYSGILLDHRVNDG